MNLKKESFLIFETGGSIFEDVESFIWISIYHWIDPNNKELEILNKTIHPI